MTLHCALPVPELYFFVAKSATVGCIMHAFSTLCIRKNELDILKIDAIRYTIHLHNQKNLITIEQGLIHP